MCNKSRNDARGEYSLLSPSPFPKRVASSVTMVTRHFMLTESTGFRSFALQCNYDTRCIHEPV